VEEGKAPERLLASKVDGNGKLKTSRPLCPYPLVAIHDGKGDASVAESFACGTRE
jgi:feruloyl esterase